jgi:hypothetical protein
MSGSTTTALLATRETHARAALALLENRQSAGLTDGQSATTQRATARTQAASGQYAEALATLQAAPTKPSFCQPSQAT